MTSDVSRVFREDRRLCVLRVLGDAPGQSANTSVLQSALGALGHDVSRDIVAADAAWLDAQGLVRREIIGPVTKVTLTGAGEDVAAGRGTHPGVKRPRQA